MNGCQTVLVNEGGAITGVSSINTQALPRNITIYLMDSSHGAGLKYTVHQPPDALVVRG